MPKVFPTLASGACYVKSDISGQPLAKYPMQQTLDYGTRVVRFLNDAEQSWSVRKPLAAFVLDYKKVQGYDLGLIVQFFNQFLGRYTDQAHLLTFQITVNGFLIDYCVFDQDEISVTEDPNSPNYFNFSLRIKQVRL